MSGALERLRRVADAQGVELLEDDSNDAAADIAVVLGGDGTMLRALTRFLGTGVPVIGVNYGRVGFLTAIPADELEDGVARAFAGEYRSVELSTLEVSLGDVTRVAVNDVVVAGGTLGRMVELGLRDRRRGARHAAVRRAHLRDRRPDRPPTTCRTAARFSSGGSTRWC